MPYLQVKAWLGVGIKNPPDALSGPDRNRALLGHDLIAVRHLHDPACASLDELQVGRSPFPHAVRFRRGVHLDKRLGMSLSPCRCLGTNTFDGINSTSICETFTHRNEDEVCIFDSRVYIRREEEVSLTARLDNLLQTRLAVK